MHPVNRLKSKLKKCISGEAPLKKDMDAGMDGGAEPMDMSDGAEQQMQPEQVAPEAAQGANQYDEMSLKAIVHHVSEAQRHMNAAGNIPEWITGKIAVASQALADVAHFLDSQDPNGVSVEPEQSAPQMQKSTKIKLKAVLKKAQAAMHYPEAPVVSNTEIKHLEHHVDGTKTLHYGRQEPKGASTKIAGGSVLNYKKMSQEGPNKQIKVHNPEDLKKPGVMKS